MFANVEATADRRRANRCFESRSPTDRGILTFSSVTKLDEDRHRLILTERHTLKNDNGEQSSDYQFTMQC